MFATKFSKTLVSAVFIEIVLFWILLLAGKGIDKLMNDLYPNTDNKEQSIIVLNIQIVLITLLSVLGRPFIINQLGNVVSTFCRVYYFLEQTLPNRVWTNHFCVFGGGDFEECAPDYYE